MSKKRENSGRESKTNREVRKPLVFDDKLPPIKSFHAVPFTNANEILPIPGGVMRVDDETLSDKLR